MDMTPDFKLAFDEYQRHVTLYGQDHPLAGLSSLLVIELAPIEQIEALEQLRVLWTGYSIAVYKTPDAPLAGVDTLADLLRAQKYFE